MARQKSGSKTPKPADKRTSGGKSASDKKTAAAKSSDKAAGSRKKSTPETQLIGEIEQLLQMLDLQALEFIKRQAEILSVTEELARSRKETITALERVSTAEPLPAAREAQPAAPAVAIEQKQENAFFIRTYGKKVFFNRTEMRELARLAYAAQNQSDGARRLYTWLKRERNDFLVDTGVAGPVDPALKLLWEQIVSTYAPPSAT